MDKSSFERQMRRARAMQSIDEKSSDFWRGYQRGMRRRFHGESFGTVAEHEQWMALVHDDIRRGLGIGYRAGYYYPEMAETFDPKRIRELLTWSVAEVAEVAEVSPRTVEGWEQGRTIPAPSLALLKQYLAL